MKALYYATSIGQGYNMMFLSGPKTTCVPEDIHAFGIPFIVDSKAKTSAMGIEELKDNAEAINLNTFKEILGLCNKVVKSGKSAYDELVSDLREILDNSPFIEAENGLIMEKAAQQEMGMSM